MRTISGVIGLLVLRLALAVGADPAAPTLPPPIYTRQMVFAIPFRLDPVLPGARKPLEVQLHVSENGGPWKLYSRVPPDQRSFTYRAGGDGEFRFMVRTRDERDELQPAGPPLPELVVVLDTEAPRLELVAEPGTAGEIRVRWRLSDLQLRPDGLRLEYQLSPGGPWLPVAVDPIRSKSLGVAVGEATWVPNAEGGTVTLRAEATDAAGNVARTQQQVDRPRTPAPGVAAGPAGSTGRPDEWRAPGVPAARDMAEDLTRWPAEKTTDSPLGASQPPDMASRFPLSGPAGRPTSLAGRDRRTETLPPGTETAAEIVAPRIEGSTGETLPPPAAADELLAQSPPAERLSISEKPEEVPLPDFPDPRERAPRTQREVDALTDGPRLPTLGSAQSVPEARYTSRERTPRDAVSQKSSADVGGEMLPAGVRPRMVNSPRFELDYDIESVGPAGVGKVEAWGTRDGGQTWTSYGVDADNRSPFVVNVDVEGLYGFRIVVESGTGLRGEPPRSGDAPEVWVGVDTTKPTARLTSAVVGSGPQSGELSIHWEASDTLLAERPIGLSFSQHPTGPWSTIAVGLENTGAFAWRLDNRAPDRVFLRLEARDEAGNTQTFVTSDSVSLDPVRPKGRIRGVRPVGDVPSASAGPQRIYNFR